MTITQKKNHSISIVLNIALLIGLYLLTRNFLLFHAYAEGFSIAIAILMFVVTWNARHFIDNFYIHFVGLSYLFVANIDFLHTLGYMGMNVFPDYSFYANQLWILGRAMEALSLLVGFRFIRRREKFNEYAMLGIYTVISAIGILSIFTWKIFPEAFIEGVGQTPFKISAEYAIIAVLLVVLYLLRRHQSEFSDTIYRLLRLSIITTILAELFFTFYIDNYGISNVLGHYFKIISFFLIYKSIIEKGIREPYEVIFHKLEQKRKELKASNAAKTKLFSIISHDLRSPFNGIIGVSDLLVSDEIHLEPEEEKEMLLALNRSSREAYSLVNNLLDWSQMNLEGITLQKERLHPHKVIERVLRTLEEPLDRKDLKISIEGAESLIVTADERSLELIFRNILSNAIKYSYRGGRIQVSLASAEGQGIVTITDEGPGMSPERLQTVRESLYNKSLPGTEEEKGTGLGLGLVKEFIAKNGGAMEIESEKRKGTTFRLAFPGPQA